MSYGMHDYLAEKAMQNYGMRKYANRMAEQAAFYDHRTVTGGVEPEADKRKKENAELDRRVREGDDAVKQFEENEKEARDAERAADLSASLNFANNFGLPHPLRASTANLRKSKAALNNAIYNDSIPGANVPPYLLAANDKRGWLEKSYSRVRNWVDANPALAMDLLGFSGGAALGASLYSKNRLLGGVAGGISGLLATVLGRGLYNEYKA